MEALRRRRKRQEGYFEHTAIGDRTQDHSLATFILNPLCFFFENIILDAYVVTYIYFEETI